MSNFPAFPKITRLAKPVVITEKIDGTNGLIYVDYTDSEYSESIPETSKYWTSDGTLVAAGSRSRWISPDNDNHGFAKWVWENGDVLAQLGQGHHYGEWWGSGIQRGYGLPKGEKRFSLFNVGRWRDPQAEVPISFRENSSTNEIPVLDQLRVVPVVAYTKDALYDFDVVAAHNAAKDVLTRLGSRVSYREGVRFERPEGLMLYWEAANMYMKAPFDDGQAKGARG